MPQSMLRKPTRNEECYQCGNSRTRINQFKWLTLTLMQSHIIVNCRIVLIPYMWSTWFNNLERLMDISHGRQGTAKRKSQMVISSFACHVEFTKYFFQRQFRIGLVGIVVHIINNVISTILCIFFILCIN